MSLYESVFIVRQDVSSTDVDKIVDDFTKIVQDFKGKVVKNEYWGLRNLAYEIHNNKKGHYVLLGIDSEYAAIAEIERKMRLSENIIRFLTSRVEEISKEPSPILRSASDLEKEDTIDVTIGKHNSNRS